MIRPVLRYPNPTLRAKTEEMSVEEITSDATREMLRDMVETMYAKNGVGLASIQVGWQKRVFIVEASAAGGDRNDPPLVFINPKVEWLSDETETKDEGCLSFPSVFVPIKRSLKARCRALNAEGVEFVLEGENLLARAFQHEIDHLDNRLIIDFVGPVKRQMIKRKFDKMTDEEADELLAEHGE